MDSESVQFEVEKLFDVFYIIKFIPESMIADYFSDWGKLFETNSYSKLVNYEGSNDMGEYISKAVQFFGVNLK